MDREQLTNELRERASQVGFSLCGVCPAIAPPGLGRFDEWLAAGFAGEMNYLVDRREAYAHPSHVLDGARSVVMVAMNYRTAEPKSIGPGKGRVSRYAWGEADYHDVLRERLNQLVAWLHEVAPGSQARGVVDTAPLMEREFAQLAGLGWIGKNTLLLNRDAGSWFFLGALVTDLELVYDAPHETDHCGKCRACLDACPTNAFVAPYVLNASRCISYLTIELRDAIPNELRPGIGEWLFGCDVCQDVCPWNSRSPQSREQAFEPKGDSNPVDLIALFDLDDAAFRERFRKTPLWRAKRRGVLRNAAIVLGNQRAEAALPALARGLNDIEPLVRGACAWALGRLGNSAARVVLAKRQAVEIDADVRSEIAATLAVAVDRETPQQAESIA